MKKTLSLPVLALLLAAPAAAAFAQPPAAASSPRSVPPKQVKTSPASRELLDRIAPQGFSVVLVVGDMQGAAGSQDDVPPAARKALADMKDFLPYKSYRLVDSHWSLCCGGRSPILSRLLGPEGQEYELELSGMVARTDDGSGVVNVRFQLAEARGTAIEAARSSASGGATSAELRTQLARTEEQLAKAREAARKRQQVGTGIDPDRDPSVVELERRLADLRIKLAQVRDRGAQSAGGPRHRPLIDTSFRMDVGETVVVGTSRVRGGDKALIALLTAVPQKTTGTR